MLTRRLLLLILGASTATWLSLSVVNAEPAKSRNQADADGSHDGRTQQQILAGWTQRAQDVANSRLTWTENRIYPRGEMISPNRKETPVDDLVVQWNKSLVIVGDRCRIEGSGKTWLERIGDFAPFEFMAVLNSDASSLHRYPGQPETLGYRTSFLPGLCDVTYRPAMLRLNPVDRNLGHINLDDYRVDPNPIDINGRKCIKLMRIDNRNVDTHVFLDPERQFVVTRTVGLEGGKIARSLNLLYRQDGRGIWYPASWTLEIMSGTGTNHGIHITVVSTNFESQFDAGRQVATISELGAAAASAPSPARRMTNWSRSAPMASGTSTQDSDRIVFLAQAEHADRTTAAQTRHRAVRQRLERDALTPTTTRKPVS